MYPLNQIQSWRKITSQDRMPWQEYIPRLLPRWLITEFSLMQMTNRTLMSWRWNKVLWMLHRPLTCFLYPGINSHQDIGFIHSDPDESVTSIRLPQGSYRLFCSGELEMEKTHGPIRRFRVREPRPDGRYLMVRVTWHGLPVPGTP